jgi:hypothetical protein
MRRLGGRVEFSCDRETAFDYLVDPRRRPEWQSSLRRVSEVDGVPRVGQTWVDETKAGIKPRLMTTELDRPVRWSESGTWRFVRADLKLRFEAVGEAACDVHYSFRVHALGPLGLAATVMSSPVVSADLRRAARLLAGQG